MSKKIYPLLIAIIVLIAVSVTALYIFQAPARNESLVTVGVKVGDVFTYKFVGYADSHVSFSIPENFADVNKTDYYRVEITKVEAPIVSYTVTLRFNNGTQFSYDGMINLENGLYSEPYWDIYASNLSTGSLSRPGSPDEPRISSTQLEPYPDGDREIHFVRSEYELYDTTDLTYTKTCYVYHYVHFDKQTGMMTNYKIMQVYNSPEIILTVEYTLVDSNVFQIS
jgi:hypothetical protein